MIGNTNIGNTRILKNLMTDVIVQMIRHTTLSVIIIVEVISVPSDHYTGIGPIYFNVHILFILIRS